MRRPTKASMAMSLFFSKLTQVVQNLVATWLAQMHVCDTFESCVSHQCV